MFDMTLKCPKNKNTCKNKNKKSPLFDMILCPLDVFYPDG